MFPLVLVYSTFPLYLHFIQEKNATIAQHTAHDYSSRISTANEIDRARSASIERDILDTLNDDPSSPPLANNNASHLDELETQPSAPHTTHRAKGRKLIDSDVESLLPPDADSIQTSSRKRKRADAGQLSDSASNVPPVKKKTGRRKPQTNDDPLKPAKAKRGPRKAKGTATPGTASKLPSEEPQAAFQPPSQLHSSRLSPSVPANALPFDITPMPSAPPSPTIVCSSLQGIAPGFWPLNEPIPPMNRPKKLDQSQAVKRVLAIEEAQRRVWINIARRDIARVSSNILLTLIYFPNPFPIARCTDIMELDSVSKLVITSVWQVWQPHRPESPVLALQSPLKKPKFELSG